MRPSPAPFELAAIARLPDPSDNVAVATRRLEAGTVVRHGGRDLELQHTVLEGHRFVVQPIAAGAALTSWGLPFGDATRDLAPGEYACNERILLALGQRDIDFALPASANFSDRLERFAFDEARFVPGRQVPLVSDPGTFEGYDRPGGRGVGTRNHVIVLATSSRANAFASTLARRFRDADGFDGVVAVTHTEGGTESAPHNRELVLRTLAGFMVHPNAGAVIALDYAGPGDGNIALRGFATEHGYALDPVPHAFFSIDGEHEAELDRAAGIIEGWLPAVAAQERRTAPLAALKVALQCGGSDAFSGVSGNALAGWVGKLLIAHGGSIAIAETDELMGAEAYVLRNVRDLDTAHRLLDVIERFKERISFHGATAEGNPSGGNNYRGLYNIALKSLGAARKFDPDVRLDHVLDYAQPMTDPGCSFIDSPGNDLESIAGQVAAGCNLIFFTTGNGSITNFPFVPTLKFVTTSGRFELLADEMDVNAGRYNDGESMADLGGEIFALARAVADGQRTKGEAAGHSQVQIWRDWQQTDMAGLERVRTVPAPDGRPLDVRRAEPSALRFEAFATDDGPVLDQVGLVMPTSLCSGQIARIIAERLDDRRTEGAAVTRYVSLVHTEGCGSANTDDVFLRTLLGHVRHPFVRACLLLEHGCEQTHNDRVRGYLREHGQDPADFGWASIQLDGGLRNVGARVEAWFDDRLRGVVPNARIKAGASDLSLGLLAQGEFPAAAGTALAELAAGIVAAGGTVIVPSTGPLARDEAFRDRLLAPTASWRASLAYGQSPGHPGLHLMDAPTTHATETITGLGSCGVGLIVAHVDGPPVHAHPMIPTLQIGGTGTATGANLDLAFGPDDHHQAVVTELERLIRAVAAHEYVPRLVDIGLVDFQLTRGRLGVSM